MKRQLLVGLFGADDQIEISMGSDEQKTFVQLIEGKNHLAHGIGSALSCLNKLGIYPSEIGLDLLILAALVHAADTRISREQQSQDSWTREIRLVVPVSDPEKWNATTPILKKMLNFLTGDLWEFGFRNRPLKFQSLVEQAEGNLVAPSFDTLSLFSGGLDSLIGAIDLLQNNNIPLLISHSGDGAASNAQNQLFSSLKDHYKENSFARLRVNMNFKEGLVKGVSSDKNTRGRSFLFFTLGVFAGTGFRYQFTLRVPENGLIALNVPLDPLRLGSNSTRTTHPYYMARWNELLQSLDINGKVLNPYWDQTKGEMVSNCLDKNLLKQLAPDSLSCSSPTKGRWQGLGIEHCGYCLPCIIRRAALETALGNDTTHYTVFDLHSRELNTLKAEGVQIRSFQYAIERLKKQRVLASVLIHKPGSLADETKNLDQLASVYYRGLMEVSKLINGVQTRPK
ncbi:MULTISPECIES: Qat anti-phage system QueC-like protein QatC [Providencia]|uniref:Qat anti-phage system QueC-like protein QatC n=1 Tax=Providencia TaxID=586 RepID=UPI00118350D0|nr:Qat anti-phage system QueC-like protein QatC [Providencia rettgeri]